MVEESAEHFGEGGVSDRILLLGIGIPRCWKFS